LSRNLRDSYLETLKDRLNRLVVGDPMQPETKLGPLVSRDQFEQVNRYLELGRSEFDSIECGRRQAGLSKGFYVNPTLLTGVPPNARVAQEEIFGPVLATLTFDDMDEVADMANKNVYGLAAAIWTSDIKKAHQLSRRLRAGTVWINTYGLMDAALPFGGYKQSGFGRELGMHAIEHYTELKTVWMNL